MAMMSKKVLCVALLLVLLPACAAADQYVGGIPLTTEESGVVSGGLWYDSFVGTSQSDIDITKTFTLPAYTEIKWARLYTSAYCGHMQNNYKLRATVRFDGGNGMKTLGVEDLEVPYSFPVNGGDGPVWVNDHCNRVTSDYLMWYDVTDQIKDGTVTAHVTTEKAEGFTGTFDGRIKIITLVVAYDDGDGDEVYYWVNQGHDVHSYYVEELLGETFEGETTFSTNVLPEDDEREYAADLSVVYMASNVGEFTFNGESLDAHDPQGAYSGYQTWDVTDAITPGGDSALTYTRDMSVQGSSESFLGAFFKIPLALLSVKYPEQEVGTLQVTSSPDGAGIYLDDELLPQMTNTTLGGIVAGEHTVRVERERYQVPDDRYVTVKKGTNTTVHFDLQPITGSIEVTSEPSGAWVYLDGGDYENANMSVRTPTTLNNLIIGDYTVEARLDGYSPVYKTASVEEDGTTAVNLVFGSSGDDAGGDGSTPDYGYAGTQLKTYLTGTLHGNVSYYAFSDYTGLIHAGETREFSIDVPAVPNATVRMARLYIYTTWGHDDKLKSGTEARIVLKVDGTEFRKDRVYGDRKNEGVYNYLLETLAYNVTDLKGGIEGAHVVTVTNDGRKDDVFATYGVGMLVVVEDPAAPEMTYWIDEGSDTLYANPDFGTTSDDCITTAPFDGTIDPAGVGAARLILLSTAASGVDDDEHRITFNDGEWFNLLVGGSSAISVAELNVRPYLLTSGNEAEIQSYITSTKGDYMENRGAILVVQQGAAGAGSAAGTAAGNVTPAVGQTPISGGVTRLALNESDGRLEATHVLSKDGVLELFVPEGTVITDGTGKHVTTLTLKTAIADGNWTCTVGEDDLKADIPITMIVHMNRLNFTGAYDLVRYDGASGAGETIDTEVDAQDGTLTARITQGGTYGLRPGTVQSGPTFLDGVIGFFGNVATVFLGIFGLNAPEETSLSPGNVSGIPGASGVSVEPTVTATTPTPVDITTMQFDLAFLSNPPGALVYLDGEYLGSTTPVTLHAIAGGNHTVRMVLDEFDPVEETVRLAHDDEVYLTFDTGASTFGKEMCSVGCLRAWEENRYGGVYVDSYPEEADVYVDGKKIDRKTPELVYGLKEGMHTIKVKKNGAEFRTDKQRVWIDRNAVTTVMFTSGPDVIERSINLESGIYSGCPFSVNGRYAAGTIPDTIDVAGINGYVTVHVNGSVLSEEISDFIETNGTMKIRTEIPAPCSVLVASEPAGAGISVDGFSTGVATPYVIENLSEGRHLISVSKPGSLPAEKDIYLTHAGRSGPDAEVDLRMDPYTFGSMTVESAPSGAKIYLFNRDTGMRTPHTFHYLKIGSYDVKVVGEGGSKVLEDVVVQPYETTECEADLSAS
ncbi:MAG: hypothetical protein PWP08_1447 [Methanofollis sp.]|nr:hypothetical protein [Methanofollis sp.]